MTLWEIVLLIYGIGFAMSLGFFAVSVGIYNARDFFISVILSLFWFIFMPAIPLMIIFAVGMLIAIRANRMMGNSSVSLKDIEDMKE